MAIISIKRRREERRDGSAALYAVFHINREKIRIPLDLYVTDTDWDPVAEKIKGRGPVVRDQNLIIENTRGKINDVMVRARLGGIHLTKELFFTLYRRPNSGQNFIDFAWQRLKSNKRALACNTWRQHKSILKKIEEYNPTLQFYEITPDFLKLYVAYLRQLGNGEATIWKNMTVLRGYILAAVRAGFIIKNPLESFRVKRAAPNIVYLTEDELKLLVDLFLSEELEDQEQEVLRFFLFMTFTSLHIGDARAVTIESIYHNELHYVRKKTRKQVCVPLSEPAQRLINYYKGERKHGPLIVDLTTDQNINRKLKSICDKVGIFKQISAKAARHTFATLYYKKNKGDIATLSNILGHSSLAMTMIYAHIDQENRDQGIHVFDELAW
jgi:integrase